MIVADFFSGMGGASEGARLAGATVALAANHWPEAVEWHERNHPWARHLVQDLQQLDMRELPDLSRGILWAAPECQGHSQNSQPARRGTGGSHRPSLAAAQSRTILQRSTAWAVVSAAEIARPRTILIENVPELERWELYGAWTGALEALGYHVRPHVIDARAYGSPQARRRMILTARLGAPLELSPALEVPHEAPRTLHGCLDMHEAPEHRWSDIGSKSARMLPRMRKAQQEAGALCLWNNVSEARGRPLDGDAPTLTTKSGSQLYLLDGERCRILNPRELARIQGFPDHYLIPAQRELASKLIGNALDVRVSRGVTLQALEA
jgi:DNA (cytosine-5)-methyltransferase 1